MSRFRVSSLRARIRHRIARFALSLPSRVQVALSGGKPVVIDGLTLNPELQLMFALQRKMGAKKLTEGEVERCRYRMRRDCIENAGPLVEVGAVRDLTIDGPAGPLRARHYAPPKARGDEPLLVYFHGGGFVLGDVDTHDPGNRLLCRHGGVHVLSVEYRLAPEHPFPAAFEDALAAFQWACANAASLGADASRVGVGGDSAGAHLSCVVSTYLVHRGERAPSIQVLLYPPIDRETVRPSVDLFAEGFILEKNDIARFQDWYSGHLKEPDARAMPLHAMKHPKGLAKHPHSVVVTAGFDPLRDEGEEYAAHLERAGNSVVLRRFDDLVHGFNHLVGVSPTAREAFVEIAGIMRAMFENAPAHTERAATNLRSIA
jgi:acetyl esterase